MAAQILILTAVQIEARHLAKALGIVCPGRSGCTSGRVGDAEIRLCMVGMKAKALPALEPPKPDCIILAGFAGALDPSLCVGDVVVDTGPNECEVPSQCIRGTVHGTDRVIATPAQKGSLFSATKSMAVDMESGVVRNWAAKAGVPLVIIRAISDAADETLNEDILRLIDEYGAVSFVGVLKGLARRPSLTVELLRLGRAARIAGKNLGRAVHQFIEIYAKTPGRSESPT
jgi:nucleoside phosphorylase